MSSGVGDERKDERGWMNSGLGSSVRTKNWLVCCVCSRGSGIVEVAQRREHVGGFLLNVCATGVRDDSV